MALREALTGGAAPKAKLPADQLSHLALVLAELTAAERGNAEVVRSLLEPCLLDALKSGRQCPVDRRSEAMVDSLCRVIFEHLSATAAAGLSAPSAPSVPLVHLAPSLPSAPSVSSAASVPLAPSPAFVIAAAAGAAAGAGKAATLVEDCGEPLCEEEAALLWAMRQLPGGVVLPLGTLGFLAARLAELSDAELADCDEVAALLEPVLLDAFHECGEWPSTEDDAHVRALSLSTSREFFKLRELLR